MTMSCSGVPCSRFVTLRSDTFPEGMELASQSVRHHSHHVFSTNSVWNLEVPAFMSVQQGKAFFLPSVGELASFNILQHLYIVH